MLKINQSRFSEFLEISRSLRIYGLIGFKDNANPVSKAND